MVRLEPVPSARVGAARTRDFQDVVAWLWHKMARIPICVLLRVRWDTVGRIVSDHLDWARLDELVRIGVDEISWRKGQR